MGTQQVLTRPHGAAIHGRGRAAEPKVWLGEDGILRIDYGPLRRITPESMESAYRQQMKLCQTWCPVLIFAHSILSVDFDAVPFPLREGVERLTTAVAIVTSSSVGSHLGQFLVWYHSPPYPVRLCSSQDEALSWLGQFDVPC